MIRHTVMFTLKHAPGSAEEKSFLDETLVLMEIPTVKKFERLRQVCPKCNHQFGLSMEFDTEADFQTYNEHEIHTRFVNDRWIPEVASFQEIDYVRYDEAAAGG